MNTPTVGQLKGLWIQRMKAKIGPIDQAVLSAANLSGFFLARSGVGSCRLETTENSRCARPKSSAKR